MWASPVFFMDSYGDALFVRGGILTRPGSTATIAPWTDCP